MQNSRIKVLYIAGSGRSGTTILSGILGQIPGYLAIGEPYYLWDEGLIENKLCGCGSELRSCKFWEPVLRNAFGEVGDETVRNMLSLRNHAVRTRHLLKMVGGNRQRFASKSFADYLDATRRLYSAIAEESGCKVIVDASKFPSYALLLSQIALIDLYLLHIVRDPRAVVYSWQRKKFDPGSGRIFGRSALVRSSSVWVVWNLAIKAFFENNKHKYKRMRYEDFVDEPKRAIREIADFVQEGSEAEFLTGDGQFALTPTHSIAGNPVRFQRGEVLIKKDREWAGRMSLESKTYVTMLTLPLLDSFDYPVKS